MRTITSNFKNEYQCLLSWPQILSLTPMFIHYQRKQLDCCLHKKKKKHQFCYYFNCWFIGRKFIRKFSVVSLTSAFNHFNFFRQKATEKQSQKPHNPNIFSVKIFSLQSIFFMYACHARRMKRAHLHFYVQSPSTQ